MLFAPSAKHAPALQLTTLQQLKEPSHQQQSSSSSVPKVLVNGNEVKLAEQSIRKPSKSEEIVEAMMKLDAKLVAYLAGDGENLPCKDKGGQLNEWHVEEEDEQEPEQRDESKILPIERCLVGDSLSMSEELLVERKLEVFKSLSAIKLQLEALTLQPEGTRRMELLQSEIRPIFTVECQLSHELIQTLPRYDMFHIMQFESEKFQSLTQCTRFGQEAERAVCLSDVDVNGNNGNCTAPTTDGGKLPNLGRIHFIAWWREPGTCLNEMLGMGVLELRELYDASLLEQCKRILINRRGVHLASLYLKVSLRVQQQQQQQQEQGDNNSVDVVESKQEEIGMVNGCGGGGVDNVIEGDNKGSDTGNKPDNEEQQQKQQEQQQQQQQQNQSDPQTETSNCMLESNSANKSNAATSQNNNNENISQVETTNFTAETNKVRLLKGFIYANETRNFQMNTNRDYFLLCRRFWQDDEVAATTSDGGGQNFNYQEQFSVINDEKFLKRVDKQHLQLEVWQRYRRSTTAINDKNGNADMDWEPMGVIQLPLHQFYIAYKDEVITNHLCKGKLPVISIDAWASIIDYRTHGVAGEMKCLLAIGSEEQIVALKEERGLNASPVVEPRVKIDNAIFSLKPLKVCAPFFLSEEESARADNSSPGMQMKKTSDLLDMLQQALSSPPVRPQVASTQPVATFAQAASNPLRPLQQKSFKFALDILRATGLPLNPSAKGKKSAKRNASKRFPPNEAPSTYVTFQADDCPSKVYKSHEGSVYATNIVEKSTQPQWQQHFRVSVSVDYLKNHQKRFILKIWKKAATDLAHTRLQPTPMDDAIIGFAAIDLSVFTQGLHIGGWFNIVDFNGRINGQLEMRCQPLENVHKIVSPQPTGSCISATATATATSSSSLGDAMARMGAGEGEGAGTNSSVDAVIDQFENSLDLAHLNLGQAIKRKFTELEEISHRLRTRLVDVTGEQLGENFDMSSLDNWQPFDVVVGSGGTGVDNDNDDDLELAEFERDINTMIPSATGTATTDTAATINTTNTNSPSDNPEILLISTAEPLSSRVSMAADKNNKPDE